MSSLIESIAICVERGKINAGSPYPPDMKGEDGADELTKRAIESGISPSRVLNEALMVGMHRIGEKFRDGRVFVPDVLIAAKAMNAAMTHIKPFFRSKEVKYKGSVVIGTVSGDLHDIGKNILGMILEGGGWEVIDLGVDVSPEEFLAAAKGHSAKAVCLSALLTTTMMNMENIIKKIKPLLPEVRIIVGGAPLTQTFSEKIGADAYFPDPQGALEYINKALV